MIEQYLIWWSVYVVLFAILIVSGNPIWGIMLLGMVMLQVADVKEGG